MTKYIGPKTDGANVATQSDVGGSSLSDATPDALTPDQAGAAGTVNSAARADHAHEIICAAAGAILPDDVAAEGTASSFARSDHTHSISAAAPGTITPDAAAAEGSSSSFARADHTHAIVAASAGTITGTNAEGSSTSFARADHDHALSSALSNALAPTGSIMAFAGTVAPTGWLLCDGSQQAVATYGALDSVLGTTYGSRTNGSGGAGSSHFRLPDLQGRVVVGKGTHADVDALNDSDGITTVANRRPKHQHTVYDPGHGHTVNYDANSAWFSLTNGANDPQQGAGSRSYRLAGITVNTNTTGVKVNPENASSSSSPTDAPAYLVLNYIIKT